MSSSESEKTALEIKNFLNTIKSTVPLWVLGTEEKLHQNGLINVFGRLSPQNKLLDETVKGLSSLVWMQNPLDIDAARTALEYNGATGFEKKSRLQLKIISTPKSDIPEEDLENLIRSESTKLIIKHLFPFLRGPNWLSWLAKAWNTILRLGNPELPVSALDMVNWPDELNELNRRLTAEYKFLYSTPEEALQFLETLDSDVWSLWKSYMKSELLLKAGRKEEAVEVLTKLWKQNIWNLNWGQKLHSLRYPLDTSNSLRNSKDVAILLYSWNNGGLMENTLKNISSSRIGEAKVFALNNGSNDSTGEVVASAGKLFAKNRYRGIQLPVNVGAPPARNWLLSEPEVRKSKWAVFLDDDVELPDHWLEELLATADKFKNPGVVGCRITSTSTPRSLQSADYHLFHPGNGSGQIEGLHENILVFDSCRNAFDYGQFSYTRPAVHLSGCCHMLNMDAIHKCGDFDARFNPTQFDDLERDIRAYLAGYNHVYAGQLSIGHIQHSSLAKASSIKSMAQVFGNKIKLESKYTDKDISTVFTRDLNNLWTDVEKKWQELAG